MNDALSRDLLRHTAIPVLPSFRVEDVHYSLLCRDSKKRFFTPFGTVGVRACIWEIDQGIDFSGMCFEDVGSMRGYKRAKLRASSD